MVWCCQATSRCRNKCYRSMSPYGVTRAQWFNINVYCRHPDYYLATIHQQPKHLLKLALCFVFHIFYMLYWDILRNPCQKYTEFPANTTVIMICYSVKKSFGCTNYYLVTSLQCITGTFQITSSSTVWSKVSQLNDKENTNFSYYRPSTGLLRGESTGLVTGGLLLRRSSNAENRGPSQ